MPFAPKTLGVRLRAHSLLRRSLLSFAACACMLIVANDGLGYSLRIFPTHHVLYVVPVNWTSDLYRSGDNPDQTWWLSEYGVILKSPDRYPSPIHCGLGCGGMVSVGMVQMSDFGAGGYTNVQRWYQARLNGTFPNIKYEDGPLLRYRETVFAGQPAHCAYYAGSLPGASLIVGVPVEVFQGSCFILWGNRVYQITASLGETANQQDYYDDLRLLLHILQTIRFV